MTAEFPRLTPVNHTPTSPADRTYNCIAWAAGEAGRWWQPWSADFWPLPDDLPHQEVLAVANPYLGPCPSVQTDWTPLKNRFDPFERFGRPRPTDDDLWQFETFVV